MDLISILEIALLVFLFVVAMKLILSPSYFPQSWKQAVKDQKIPHQLKKCMQAFPDKQRAMIFWLQINRILENKIEGSFADLGVYKGDSAKLIHYLAPQRQLHLFDTFKGYDRDDLQIETGEASKYTKFSFADTSA
jgi:O-methyltransferase